MAAMYDRRVTGYASRPRLAGTSATPLRSMWKRLSTQLPDLMAFTQPLVMMSWNCCITGTTSNAFTRAVYASALLEAVTFWSDLLTLSLILLLYILNRSSNSSEIKSPAISIRLLP